MKRALSMSTHTPVHPPVHMPAHMSMLSTSRHMSPRTDGNFQACHHARMETSKHVTTHGWKLPSTSTHTSLTNVQAHCPRRMPIHIFRGHHGLPGTSENLRLLSTAPALLWAVDASRPALHTPAMPRASCITARHGLLPRAGRLDGQMVRVLMVCGGGLDGQRAGRGGGDGG